MMLIYRAAKRVPTNFSVIAEEFCWRKSYFHLTKWLKIHFRVFIIDAIRRMCIATRADSNTLAKRCFDWIWRYDKIFKCFEFFIDSMRDNDKKLKRVQNGKKKNQINLIRMYFWMCAREQNFCIICYWEFLVFLPFFRFSFRSRRRYPAYLCIIQFRFMSA